MSTVAATVGTPSSTTSRSASGAMHSVGCGATRPPSSARCHRRRSSCSWPIFAPFLAPYDPLRGNLSDSFLPPSSEHWIGTNIQGQDVFSRIICGRASHARHRGPVGDDRRHRRRLPRRDRRLLQRRDRRASSCAPSTSCWRFPGSCCAIGIVTFLGRGVVQIAIAIAIVNVPIFARLLRGSLLGLRDADYVVAARVGRGRAARRS